MIHYVFCHDFLYICRHSDASNRPSFSSIFQKLDHSDSNSLIWSELGKGIHPEKGKGINPQAAVLGAPLEAGEQLYTDLQDYYLDEASKRQEHENLI